jgi:hypothetical protein
MNCKKIITTCVDVEDCLAVYSAPDNLLKILRATYEGVCYRGCIVQKVDSVLRESECVISKNRENMSGRINVTFSAEVVVFATGDVLLAEITNTGDEQIVADHPLANMISHDEIICKVFKKGMMVPLQIEKYLHKLYRSNVSATANLYRPSPLVACYKLIPGSELDFDVDPEIAAVTGEVERLAALKATEGYVSIEGLMYPFVKRINPTGPTACQGVQALVAATRKGPAWIAWDPAAGVEPVFWAGPASTGPVRGELPAVETAAGVALAAILRKYYTHAKAVRECSEYYSDEAKIRAHAVLWKLYNKNKI